MGESTLVFFTVSKNEALTARFPREIHSHSLWTLPVAIRPGSRAAHNAGLRLNDYVLSIAGNPSDPTINYRTLNLHVKMNYKSGQKLPLDLIRSGRKMRLDLPLH
jgi:C-terminal processing protease CtpA/Prc